MTVLGQVLRREERDILKMRRLYELYGYKKYKMNKFEHYDLYLENKSFLASNNIVTFTDTGGTLLALKPDITLSIVKNAPEVITSPEKVYYCENVYRSAGQDGGIREILQVGIEYIGEMNTYAQGEVLSLAAKSLGEVSENVLIGVSHMGLITALLEHAGLRDAARREALRCIGEKNAHELRAVCEREQVEPSAADRLTELVATYGDYAKGLARIRVLLKDLPQRDPSWQAVEELGAVYRVLEAVGCGSRVVLDFSVTNDMDYYNGITFQGFVDGIPQHVLSGGRYDTLVKKFGKDAGAIGFAIYPDLLERLAGEEHGNDVDVLLTYGDADPAAAAAQAEKLTSAGLRVYVQREDTGRVRYKERMQLDKRS